MNDLLAGFFASKTLLAVVGAFVGSLRVSMRAKDKSTSAKCGDLIAALFLSLAVVDDLTPKDMPRLALMVGILAGTMCDVLLDSARALSPDTAGGILDFVLGKLGYRRQPAAEKPPVVVVADDDEPPPPPE